MQVSTCSTTGPEATLSGHLKHQSCCQCPFVGLLPACTVHSFLDHVTSSACSLCICIVAAHLLTCSNLATVVVYLHVAGLLSASLVHSVLHRPTDSQGISLTQRQARHQSYSQAGMASVLLTLCAVNVRPSFAEVAAACACCTGLQHGVQVPELCAYQCQSSLQAWQMVAGGRHTSRAVSPVLLIQQLCHVSAVHTSMKKMCEKNA